MFFLSTKHISQYSECDDEWATRHGKLEESPGLAVYTRNVAFHTVRVIESATCILKTDYRCFRNSAGSNVGGSRWLLLHATVIDYTITSD